VLKKKRKGCSGKVVQKRKVLKVKMWLETSAATKKQGV